MRLALLLPSLTLASLVCYAQSPVAGTSPGNEHGAPQDTVKDIDPSQLLAMLRTPNLYIYDCNEEDMFKEAHVPGAKLTVYDEVTAATLPTDLNAAVVFYCYSPECPAAATAARTAITLGHTNVYSMPAGITGWQDAGLRTEP